MAALLLDTHIWAWSLTGSGLSPSVTQAITEAEAIYISPISFFEIGQKVRLGKWPEMEPLASSLPEILRDQGGLIAPLSPEICLMASMMQWEHRDPFDRFLAATALINRWPLASVDAVFDSLGDIGQSLTRIA